MKNVRIAVKKIVRREDLIAAYERPLSHACDMREGQVFVAEGCEEAPGVL